MVAVGVVVALFYESRARRVKRGAFLGVFGGRRRRRERDPLLVRLGVTHVPHERLLVRLLDAKDHARGLARGGSESLVAVNLVAVHLVSGGPGGEPGPGPVGAAVRRTAVGPPRRRGVQDVCDPFVAGRDGEHRARRARGLAHAAHGLGRGELALGERDANDAPHPAAAQVLGARAHDADELVAFLVALPVEPAQVVFVFVLQTPPEDREERARGREVPPVARGELHHRPRRRRMRAQRLVVALLQLHHQPSDVLAVHGRRVRERRAQAQRDPLQLAQVLVALSFARGERGHAGGEGRSRLGLVFARN